jgi:hypothetical protein
MVERLREMSGIRRVRQLVTVFLCLQALDVLTTLYGLRLGAVEGNLFIAQLFRFGPMTALLISKVLAILLAMWALGRSRERLVRFVNFWFVAVVAWNLVVIGRLAARA